MCFFFYQSLLVLRCGSDDRGGRSRLGAPISWSVVCSFPLGYFRLYAACDHVSPLTRLKSHFYCYFVSQRCLFFLFYPTEAICSLAPLLSPSDKTYRRWETDEGVPPTAMLTVQLSSLQNGPCKNGARFGDDSGDSVRKILTHFLTRTHTKSQMLVLVEHSSSNAPTCQD